MLIRTYTTSITSTHIPQTTRRANHTRIPISTAACGTRTRTCPICITLTVTSVDAWRHLDFSSLRDHLDGVGPDCSRPATSRHFAQVLHLARVSGRGLLAK